MTQQEWRIFARELKNTNQGLDYYKFITCLKIQFKNHNQIIHCLKINSKDIFKLWYPSAFNRLTQRVEF